MRIRRTELKEVAGEFVCEVAVPTRDLGFFLGLIPTPNTAIDIDLIGAEPGAPLPAPERPPAAPAPIPLPDAPAEDHSAALADPRTQLIVPAGLDISKLGLGQSMPRELAVFVYLVKDPVFQEWVLEQTKEPQSAVPDAVEYSANWIAKRVGALTIFDITKEQYPALAGLQAEYTTFVDKRGKPP